MNNKKRLYIYHTFLSRRKDLGHFHSLKDLTNQLDYIKDLIIRDKERRGIK